MRRLTLSLPFVVLLALAAATANAAAATPASVPVLTLADATRDAAASQLRVAGKIENAAGPAIFRLRTENGCARDATLRMSTTGRGFAVSLAADDLTDAFACAIDVEVGDASLPTLTVTPDGHASTASGLSLDPTFALVSVDLDPSAGHLVRFTVNATSPGDAVIDARVTLDGAAYAAIIAPSDEGRDVATSAVFDVPASAWASAVITGSAAHVDLALDGGSHRTMTLHPTAHVEAITDDAEGGE